MSWQQQGPVELGTVQKPQEMVSDPVVRVPAARPRKHPEKCASGL